jgi:GT2 family glycosyltransferase
LEVVVVDNCSGDDSVERLRQGLDDPRVKVIASEKNGGFGYGNNLGARAATGPHLFLLNSDAFFQEDALARMLPRLGDPEVGIVAPALYIKDGVTLQADGIGPFPTVVSILTQKTKDYGASLEPDWVSGAAMLMCRDAFLSLGGFDERIFMYYEDVELCWRFRRAGMKIVRELSAGVTHLGGGSYTTSLKKKQQYFEAQDVYLRLIGEPAAGIALVRMARRPYTLIQRLKGLK